MSTWALSSREWDWGTNLRLGAPEQQVAWLATRGLSGLYSASRQVRSTIKMMTTHCYR